MTAPLRIVATCPPGLAELLAEELRALGALAVAPGAGRVAFRGHRRVLHRVHLEAGLASQVRVLVGRVEARRLGALEDAVRELPWAAHLRPGVPRRPRVEVRAWRIRHSGAIAERALAASAARLEDGLAEADPDGVTVMVRGHRDVFALSIDTAGAPLHRRGYRLDGAKAPLREDLALALLEVSGWTADLPLLDPLSGAGTILIEAARRARGIAPGRDRTFDLARTAHHHEPTWTRVLDEARARERPSTGAPIVGADRVRGALEATRANAERAGVRTDLTLEHAALSSLVAPQLAGRPAGAVVTNPPYGRRTGDRRTLERLYGALVRRTASLGPAWTLTLVLPRQRRPAPLRQLRSVLATLHGGVPVRYLSSPRPG
ncbi:MAG: class I SAM-dependent RNA methyltransferase [Sandaracinaceae bacterium]